jgi:hypothetical protein
MTKEVFGWEHFEDGAVHATLVAIPPPIALINPGGSGEV